jgi:hypothetical protein
MRRVQPMRRRQVPRKRSRRRRPTDRYLAPEMASWTHVFRFGHLLLVPTTVNDSQPMLFLLDTGAFNNILAVRAGREVTKVSRDNTRSIRGESGTLSKVYTADKASLRFGHLQQNNLDVTSVDLSRLSRDTGTEVSGILGFAMLRLLDLKLDYRDGLVDFAYDPNRFPGLSH